jgi:hypothetical protein
MPKTQNEADLQKKFAPKMASKRALAKKLCMYRACIADVACMYLGRTL